MPFAILQCLILMRSEIFASVGTIAYYVCPIAILILPYNIKMLIIVTEDFLIT